MTTSDKYYNLYNATWFRLDITLVNVSSFRKNKANMILACEAIVKAVSSTAFKEPNNIFFHIKDFKNKLNVNDTLLCSVYFVKAEQKDVEDWAYKLKEYLSKPGDNNNFQLAGEPVIHNSDYRELESGFKGLYGSNELCLEFITPLKFSPPKNKNRTFVDKETFVKFFEKRIEKLIGGKIKYIPGDDNFEILPYYWRYTEIKHSSHSMPGTVQYINGCYGRLYIKGAFNNFLPFVILCSELHTGTKFSNSQGYYKIKSPSQGYFQKYYPQKLNLVPVINDLLQKYDSDASALAEAGIGFLSEEEFAEKLCDEIREDKINFSPNSAFLIRKKDGASRMIERLNFRDLIIHEYILKTISASVNRMLEKSSIGYRKGVSREKAAEIIRKAIKEGFQYVVESDISDFFGSINHEELLRLIDIYFPENDSLIKSHIRKAVCTGYVLNGEFNARTTGLAQGSPLSPLLANLYLDSFDEYIEKWNVKLIRYADDFVILTRSIQDAENILSESESYLSHLGLKIKKEKTAITHIKEGFRFLGISFNRDEIKIEPEEMLNRFKKPLYITEPYIFLALNGDAIDIKKNSATIETIPVRRISEIMLMENVSFSSALIRKCSENNIPLTITLNSGYYVTTVKPESKTYYDIANQHAQKYYSLGDNVILAIAKDIAAYKIKNYISLFKQKYIPGMGDLIRSLENSIDAIYNSGCLNQVRGCEGASARRVFNGLNYLINDDLFKIKKRERKNPDYINSLLNFGHYLIFSRINVTLRSLGLNPYLGFLHSPDNNYESLATDIQELFRSRLERFLIRIINLKSITKDDFVNTSRGNYLTRDGVKKFIQSFENELDKKSKDGSMSLLDAIYIQSSIFKRWATEDSSITFYEWKV